MVNTAVILAAGLGSRLKEHTRLKPKGFVEIDSLAIVERSIRLLLESGIKQIWIGTGYLAEEYERLAKKYSQVVCKYNDRYQDSGSMYTLYQLKDSITEDFLLLESDLLYDGAALLNLQADKQSDIVLASGKTDSGDEVYIEVDEDKQLVNVSKQPEQLQYTYAEWVGITKVSLETYHQMCKIAEEEFVVQPKWDYEYALVKVSREHPIAVKKVEALVWCEIDDEQHLERARTLIYPKLTGESLLKETPKIKRNILLNPGPATTTDTVKWAQVVADICPREQEFGELMEWITEQLTLFVGSTKKYDTVLFGGSGTAAVEAVISSVIDDGNLLIVSNGAYGERMAQIAAAYRVDFELLTSSPVEPLLMADIEEKLQNTKYPFTHLAIVHHETTSGILNNIEAVGELCARYNLEFIVDAMSSYGAVPIHMETSQIHYLISSSNKNLQGMAGIAFVVADKEKLSNLDQRIAKSYYLNLYEQYDYFRKTRQMRFTPPVQTLYALKQAILETQIEGIDQRYRRYTRSWEVLIEGLKQLGLEYMVPITEHSHIITAIKEPAQTGYSFDTMHDYLYAKGITIYPGKIGELSSFRIANIGAIDYKDMHLFISYMKEYMDLISEQ